MRQTKARMVLKDAPLMWRRINSIGIIIDCNSTYAAKLKYTKSEIIGKPIFAHVPKASWNTMTESLTKWFETGQVTDQKITFLKNDGTTFPGLLQAVSIYDHRGALLGSNTVIFDLNEMDDTHITTYENFIKNANKSLLEIKIDDHNRMEKISKSECEGLKAMFEMLAEVDIAGLKNQ